MYFVQSCKLEVVQKDGMTWDQCRRFLCDANLAWLGSDAVQTRSVNAEGLEFSAKCQTVCKAFLS